jgi:predicted enzyme related to lactoylglutathione lyase
MHRSKLCGFIIDCHGRDLPGAAAFWSGALGMSTRQLAGAEGDSYVRLVDNQHGLHFEVQQVDHPSRVHLDIEADDIEAEVRRLEALGARRVAQIQSWWSWKRRQTALLRRAAELADFDAKASYGRRRRRRSAPGGGRRDGRATSPITTSAAVRP